MDNEMKNASSDKIFEVAKLTWTLPKTEVMECDRLLPIFSQIFPDGERKYKWCLGLQPNFRPYETIILYLERKFYTSTELVIQYSFRLKNANDEVLSEIERDVIFDERRVLVPWYINVNTLSSISNYDNIKISVVVLVKVFTLQSYHRLSVQKEENASNTSSDFEENESNTSGDFEAILKSGEFSDFVISLEDGEIPVHRAVLSARCPYFSAMFKHGMSESKLGYAKMAGVDKNTAFNLLKFLYTEKVHLTKEEAKKLLPVADQYGIPLLKNICVKTLLENLLASDIPDILILAELSDCLDLKQTVLQYIAENPTEFNVLSMLNVVKNYRI